MIVYSYDEFLLYTGASVAPVNPKRPTESLVPAYSTEVEIPTGYTIDEWPLYDLDLKTWSLVPSPYKQAQDADLAEQVLDAEAVAEEAQRVLDVENSNKTTAEGIYLFVEQPDGSFYEKTAQELADETAAFLASQALLALKVAMDTNIITKAAEITLGTTTESIQAFTSAFTLRAQNPAEYTTDGLLVYYATVGYALGDALDTEVKIVEYYNKIMIELDKFRNAEIAAYLAAKAAL